MRLGVVSFLNARPLIEGLADNPATHLVHAVPAELPVRLERGEFDAALVPIIDVIRSAGRLEIVSDACIGCDGETMTVRVFSQLPPHRVRTLHVDRDSHTSVALARVLWSELFDTALEVRTIDARRDPIDRLDAVLLIGDKVVDPRRAGFAFETDLGGAWRQHTGLPFVFAAWAMVDPSDADASSAATLLGAARDRGVARTADIARAQGPTLGWPVELAERYLSRCLTYTIDERHAAAAERFADGCERLGLCTQPHIEWRTLATQRTSL